MTKNDFLDQLRNTLNGELPESEIDSNMKFYEDYINTKNSEMEESRVMEQLGDPRLIAKTIIETYQISHAPLYHNIKHNSAYQDAHATDEDNYKSRHDEYGRNTERYAGHNVTGFSLNWFQKLSLILILIIVIVMLVVVGGILIRIFFSIGLPLIVIYLFYKVVIKNSK